MSAKLSVVVPVYNVEKYLVKCIQSIVNQDYLNLEIILVDDGSPDRCPEICDEWEKVDSRIKVIHKTNGGLSDARNAGIEVATGDYIAFVDGDDFIKKNMYSKMMSAISKTGAEIATCGRYIYDGEVEKKYHCLDTEQLYDSKTALKEMLCGGTIEEAVWDKVYKRELFCNIRFPVGEVNEDIIVMPKVLASSSSIIHVGEALYYYRKNNYGISKSGYNQRKSIVIKHIKDVKLYIGSIYSDMNNELLILQGRYACSQLSDLTLDKGKVKIYKNDYLEYIKMLKEAYPIMLKSNYIDKKKKIVATLILFRLYGLMWRIKNK